MGLWDKVKSFFGAGSGNPAGSGHDPVLVARVQRAIRRRSRDQDRFEPVDIAGDVAAKEIADVQTACSIVEELFDGGWITEIGYSRTWRTDNWVYHPVDAPLAATSQKKSAPGAKQAPPPATSPARPPVPAPPRAAAAEKEREDTYATPPGVLGLTKDELRRRALKISPYKTAWIGRVDVIPPASDERTALIDRGLVLRGFLTQEQIQEIHRIGDLWLEHRHGEAFAIARANATASSAIEELKRQKAAVKAKKRADAAERRERRTAEILERRRTDIVYLGRGVSGRLGDRRAHVERLEELGLPILATPADVAAAMAISIGELRWLAFHAEAADKPHYVQFQIPKRSGGMRTLASPQKKLAAAQRWVQDNILAKLPLEDAAHGFVRGRSTVSNASPHVGRDVVVNLDLADFFPSVSFSRVRGLFQKMGYSPAAATVFALLTTECERREVDYAGDRYWVAIKDRALPQGACTSPAISNLVVRKLDRRLRGLSAKQGFSYTRYADDLTFSAPEGHRGEIPMFLARVRHVITEEGFTVNVKKGRVQRKGGRQTVTGVVVNTKVGLPREEVRRLRAILHAAKSTGLEAQNREKLPHFEAWLRGKIAYLHMVDPKKAAPLRAALDALDA